MTQKRNRFEISQDNSPTHAGEKMQMHFLRIRLFFYADTHILLLTIKNQFSFEKKNQVSLGRSEPLVSLDSDSS